jgi:hypothetical protein
MVLLLLLVNVSLDDFEALDVHSLAHAIPMFIKEFES